MKKRWLRYLEPRVIFAVCLVLVGVFLILDRFSGGLGFSPWDLWPLLLILLGISQVCQPAEFRHTFSGGILILVGGFFLARNLDLIPRFRLEWNDIWPFLILLVGLMVLWHAIGGGASRTREADFINLSTIISGSAHAYSSKRLRGGRITAIMGGCEIDLRDSTMAGDSVTIDTFALMGGIEIRVPVEWEVRINGTPFMGGMEYKRPASTPEKRTGTLVVTGMAIMGGVEVKT